MSLHSSLLPSTLYSVSRAYPPARAAEHLPRGSTEGPDEKRSSIQLHGVFLIPPIALDCSVPIRCPEPPTHGIIEVTLSLVPHPPHPCLHPLPASHRTSCNLALISARGPQLQNFRLVRNREGCLAARHTGKGQRREEGNKERGYSPHTKAAATSTTTWHGMPWLTPTFAPPSRTRPPIAQDPIRLVGRSRRATSRRWLPNVTEATLSLIPLPTPYLPPSVPYLARLAECPVSIHSRGPEPMRVPPDAWCSADRQAGSRAAAVAGGCQTTGRHLLACLVPSCCVRLLQSVVLCLTLDLPAPGEACPAALIPHVLLSEWFFRLRMYVPFTLVTSYPSPPHPPVPPVTDRDGPLVVISSEEVDRQYAPPHV
ncbi:hypothetical protein BDV95DRAFT_590044 [Massariosphaeria phaeospora]|uniref:Uncharacterized protein n=1 Tax=Massariosphaeria phaeospora TaxID=100035 RepID=A0A7C8MFW4_9PLEO|nr:hypothetical protein BDV95DRAFT_590044 [Massariosphaeria phaeospora]